VPSHSQFAEDTHLAGILDEVGDGSRIVCDIGARLLYSNSASLIEDRGYWGALFDASEEACRELRERFPKCAVGCTRATIENVNDLVPPNTHVLSIDIDSHDWWLWANLRCKPAIVVIETTPNRGMQLAEYGAGAKSAKGYGCSIDAARALGMIKGYRYMGRTEVNAIFLRKDLTCTYAMPEVAGHGGLSTSTENNVL
jgi:hypothetical protein